MFLGLSGNNCKELFCVTISMIVSADKDELLRLKKKYDQSIMLGVYKNGEPDFI